MTEDMIYNVRTGEYRPANDIEKQIIKQKHEGEIMQLTEGVCKMLTDRMGKKFRKIQPITALKMDMKFSVETGQGVTGGEPGDYLAVDSRGKFYIIAADEFANTYRLYRGRSAKNKEQNQNKISGRKG